MAQLKKVIKIEAEINSNNSFSANGMNGEVQILEYDFAKFISWSVGELVMSIGDGNFRGYCQKIIMYSHLWFLYQIYTKES